MTSLIEYGSKIIIAALPLLGMADLSGLTQEKENAFAITGQITAEQRGWSEMANPSYALFNCQRTSIATAIMLETGVMPKISVIPIVRCRVFEMPKHCPALFENMGEDRVALKVFCHRGDLVTMMGLMGTGAHAIVHGMSKVIAATGHLFNCAIVDRGNAAVFEVIDSYGGKYAHAAKDAMKFLSGYRDEVKAVLFCDKSRGHLESLKEAFPDADIELV